MTKLGLLATTAALIAFSPLAMAQSNTGSLSNSGGFILAQAQSEPIQGQTANPPDAKYEQPDTMPTYQKNDGTDKD